MKILNWYVTKNFLVTFLMSIGIITFCMIGARLVQVLEYIAKGVPAETFVLFILYCMPQVLTFTIPLSILVSIMLVFGRLSADSEITAMRACGISILQLVSPIMLISCCLTAICLYLHVQIGPPLLEKSRSLFEDAIVDQPMAIFKPGESMTQDDYTIYVDDIREGNQLVNVQIVDFSGDQLTDFSAKEGKVHVDYENEAFNVTMYNCEGVIHQNGEPIHFQAGDLNFRFNYGEKRNNDNIQQRYKFMTMKNLMAAIRIGKIDNLRADKICEMEVELNQRIAFALAPLAFLLMGIPLAIHTSRRETSVGLFIGAVAGGVFFLLIILCESLGSTPQLYPQYLLWLPNLIYQIGGAYMVYRITQR